MREREREFHYVRVNMTNFIGVYFILSEHKGTPATATLWYVGEQTPVHENVPREGIRGGDDGREYPKSKEHQVKNTLIGE